jgi:hypothetical protein
MMPMKPLPPVQSRQVLGAPPVFAHCLANDAPQSLGFALRVQAHAGAKYVWFDSRQIDARWQRDDNTIGTLS